MRTFPILLIRYCFKFNKKHCKLWRVSSGNDWFVSVPMHGFGRRDGDWEEFDGYHQNMATWALLCSYV
jgi:hypothetical protein